MIDARCYVLCSIHHPDVNPIENIWSWIENDALDVKPNTCKEIKAVFSAYKYFTSSLRSSGFDKCLFVYELADRWLVPFLKILEMKC